MKEADVKKAKTASVILAKTKEQLKDEFPSLIYPLNILEAKEINKKVKVLCTDGESILYSPSAVLDTFRRKGYRQLKTEMMHILLHGLLGHLEMDGHYKDRPLLWAVMDLEVGNIINRLIEETSADLRTVSNVELWNEYYEELHGMDIYFKESGSAGRHAEQFRKAGGIRSDNHRYWRKHVSGVQNGADSFGNEETGGVWSESRKLLGISLEKSDAFVNALRKAHVNNVGYGSGSGAECEWIVANERNSNSYQKVLREFLRMKEDQRVEPDSFDRALYQYGLDLYGDVPIIEPPDSEETLNLNTICLAVDSSGSCSDDIARQFLRETWNVFRDVRQISSKCEVYFFVCDDEIQQEAYFESVDMLQESDWEELEMYGWGGTSFVPVFERVGEIQENEGKQIDFLIYLTDSYGSCIGEDPGYPVFFALPNDQVMEDGSLLYMPGLPEWIQFVGLGREE